MKCRGVSHTPTDEMGILRKPTDEMGVCDTPLPEKLSKNKLL
jgi:hypothetical protein